MYAEVMSDLNDTGTVTQYTNKEGDHCYGINVDKVIGRLADQHPRFEAGTTGIVSTGEGGSFSEADTISLLAARIGAIAVAAEEQIVAVDYATDDFHPNQKSVEAWYGKRFLPQLANLADEIETTVRRGMGLSDRFPAAGDERVAENPTETKPAGRETVTTRLALHDSVLLDTMIVNDDGSGMLVMEGDQPPFPGHDDILERVELRDVSAWSGEETLAVDSVALNIVGLMELSQAANVEVDPEWIERLKAIGNEVAQVSSTVLDPLAVEADMTDTAEPGQSTSSPSP